MATDTDVQFFSNNSTGLVLSNNWGDLIRVLDTVLVNGIALPNTVSASIDANGDISITLSGPHNCMAFQVVELTNFSNTYVDGVNVTINGKYRIIGLTNANQLLLKGNIVRTTSPVVNVISMGSVKLAPLGYDIAYRSNDDTKRAYRSKNPRPEHPYIRLDETITQGAATYDTAYAKSVMVGLIENMTHIDDISDTTKLQLPLDTTNWAKNWTITGTGNTVIRGWAKWYWARGSSTMNNSNIESTPPSTGNREFTIVGDKDAFYIILNFNLNNTSQKILTGAGLFNSSLPNTVVPNWFLMATLKDTAANASVGQDAAPNAQLGGLPLIGNATATKYFITDYDILNRVKSHIQADTMSNNVRSGDANYFKNDIAAIEYPIIGGDSYIRGTLKHICYAGNNISADKLRVYVSDTSLYMACHRYTSANTIGGNYFYMGEL